MEKGKRKMGFTGHNWGLCKKCGKFHKGSGITEKGHHSNPKTEWKKEHSAWNRGLTKETDYRLKMAIFSQPHSINWNNNVSKAKYKQWKQPEYIIKQKLSRLKKPHNHTEETKEKIREKRLQQVFPRRSSIEIALQNALFERNYICETQYSFKITQIDIAFPKQKLAVFCDGDYWHGNPNFFKILNGTQSKSIKRDKEINNYLIERGWKVLRFWENEIKTNVESCINKIKEVLDEKR